MIKKSIQSHFFYYAENYKLKIKERSDVSICAYSVNNELYGVVNYLIGDKDGFKYILKRTRNDIFEDKLIKRAVMLSNVLSKSKYDKIRSRVIAGCEIEIAEQKYLLFNYKKCKNCYKKLRFFLSKNNCLNLFEQTLSFCQDIPICSDDSRVKKKFIISLLEEFKSSYQNEKYVDELVIETLKEIEKIEDIFPMSIVHNDLVPSNILINNKKYWVVDWEYWGYSISAFNYFDMLINFGSFIGSRKISNRSINDYFRIFYYKPKFPITSIAKIFRKALFKIAKENLNPINLEKIFILFLMNKSICQYRVYGSHFSFDIFWSNVLKKFISERNQYKNFWNQIMD